MITGIGHIALAVSDMEASVRFYCGALGFAEAFDLAGDNGEPWIKYLRIGRQFIELFYGRADRENGHSSFQHFCLTVEDIGGTVERIRNAGVAAGEPKQGKDGNWQAWVNDPDGNAVELMQMNQDSPQMKAVGRAEA